MKTPKHCNALILSLGSALTLSFCSLQLAHAEEPNLTVGLGAAYGSANIRGYDNEAAAVPIIAYQIGRFTLSPISVTTRLKTFDWSPVTNDLSGEAHSRYQLTLSASANYADDERDNKDSFIFSGMEKREEGSAVGISSELVTPFGLFEASVKTDISGASEGTQATLGYSIPLYDNYGWSLSGSVGVNFADEKWNDYYYGVRNSEATGSRAAYSASESINPFAGISASYAINRHWTITQSSSVTQLDDTLVDSPLTTDDDIGSEFFLGVLYTY